VLDLFLRHSPIVLLHPFSVHPLIAGFNDGPSARNCLYWPICRLNYNRIA
jgi:hypothetical protein